VADTQRAWPSGIGAITVFAEDFAETRQFYVDVFGLPIAFEDESSAAFDFGNTLINVLDARDAPELIAPTPVAAPDAGARAQFTINVEDVDATCAELERRGVTLLNGPIDRPWGVRTAAFADPAGHIWEVAT
jgi:catechol 2,3-dioxygenase-like lactoylglutathione lyase family enzyme